MSAERPAAVLRVRWKLCPLVVSLTIDLFARVQLIGRRWQDLWFRWALLSVRRSNENSDHQTRTRSCCVAVHRKTIKRNCVKHFKLKIFKCTWQSTILLMTEDIDFILDVKFVFLDNFLVILYSFVQHVIMSRQMGV